MRYIVSAAVLSLVVCGVQAAQTGRPAMSAKMIMAAPRYTASVNQLNGMAGVTDVKNQANPVEVVSTTEQEPEVDMREAERDACINNNIGVGNTFVWASRNSNTSNYANMVEDLDNPQNNVCFVRVELKSDDSARVSVSDVPAKYFMWGQHVECGSWADATEMEKRILDARKGARIGGVVASSIGGAGIGVGAMELFGNKLIGVQGQKDLHGVDLYRSRLLVYKKEKPAEYNNIVNALKTLKESGENLSNEERELIDEFVE